MYNAARIVVNCTITKSGNSFKGNPMIYVLIFVLGANGYNSVQATHGQIEFRSQSNCISAQSQIQSMKTHISSVCVAK